MTIKIENFGEAGRDERDCIAWMIWNTKLLSFVAPYWQKSGLFIGKEHNKLATIVFQHYKEHKRAPKSQFERKVREKYKNSGEEAYKAVDKLLYAIEQSKNKDVEFAAKVQRIEETLNYAQNVKRQRQMQDDIEKGNRNATYDALVPIRLMQDDGILSGTESLELVLQEFAESESLFDYEGDANLILRCGDFCRGGFVSFMAREKKGKSMWLMDAALRGVIAGRNVAYFTVGDMIHRDVRNRLMCRITEHPFVSRKPNGEYEDQRVEVLYPTTVENGEANGNTKIFRKRDFMRPKRDWPAYQEWMEKQTGSLRIVSKPSSTCFVSDIGLYLESWRLKYDWKADMVIIDYADVLAMKGKGADFRHNIDDTWQEMRGLSQEKNVLLLTATQATRFMRNKETDLLKTDNISEDKRKAAHTTAMYGINWNKAGVYRINCMVRRTGGFDDDKWVWAGSCLPFSMPIVVSSYYD